MIIEQVKKEDVEKLSEMIYSCIDNLKVSDEGKKFMKEHNSIEYLSKLRKERFILKDKENIYATASLKNNLLVRVFTSPSKQGQGYGKKIMEFIFDYAKEKGLSKIITHAVIPSIGFYEKIGFVKKEQINVDCYCMEKVLWLWK